MAVLDPICIPPEALMPKPWFSAHPGPEIVREIKEFIAETGRPYLWRGHTHTEPPAGARVAYIGEFDLPERYRAPYYRAPCPCCSPIYPKYWELGKIAWFPDECVIRIIGPDCFRKLNPEGHDDALAAFRAEQQRERDIKYLLENLPVVPKLRAVVDKLFPTALAVDEFRATLQHRLNTTLRIDLWREIREGKLMKATRRTEAYVRADGTEGSREVDDLDLYASIEGHALLQPKAHRFAPQLQTIADSLDELSLYQEPEATNPQHAAIRQKAAKSLGRQIRNLREISRAVGDLRKFASITTTATLRNWGQQKGRPLEIYAERTDNDFYIGIRREEKLRIELPLHFDDPLPELPALGEESP